MSRAWRWPRSCSSATSTAGFLRGALCARPARASVSGCRWFRSRHAPFISPTRSPAQGVRPPRPSRQTAAAGARSFGEPGQDGFAPRRCHSRLAGAVLRSIASPTPIRAPASTGRCTAAVSPAVKRRRVTATPTTTRKDSRASRTRWRACHSHKWMLSLGADSTEPAGKVSRFRSASIPPCCPGGVPQAQRARIPHRIEIGEAVPVGGVQVIVPKRGNSPECTSVGRGDGMLRSGSHRDFSAADKRASKS